MNQSFVIVPATIEPLPARPDIGARGGLWDGYSPKSVGPKYPPHDANAPIFGSEDAAGFVAAIVITLGPLAAYALGFGL